MRISTKSDCVNTLYIDFDAFFANVEKQLDPDLHGRPVLVCPMDSPHSGVIACCYVAKAFGVKRSMSRAEALSLAPTAVFKPARHDVYVDLHHQIIEIVERFAPVTKAWSIDEMECDLGALKPEAAVALAEEIREALSQEIGPLITPSIGLASNQLLAKIAAEMDKPRGLVLLEPSQMPSKITAVPLKDVPGIASGMLERLRRANVTTMPDLLELAPKQARAIWGNVEGERMWRALNGEYVERPETKRSMFGHSRVLARGWQSPEKAKACLRLLTTKAARRLREGEYFASKLTISYKTFNGGKFKTVREFSGLRDDKNLLRIMEETFDQNIKNSGTKRLKRVTVLLHGLRKERDMSGDLFCDIAATSKDEALSDVMDELNAKFGGNMLHLGQRVDLPGGYAGGKIAFGRIPSRADFGIGSDEKVPTTKQFSR